MFRIPGGCELSLSRICWQVLACCALLGCSGATWQKVDIDSPYQVPKEMKIAVVAKPELSEASQALTDALLSGLKSHGVRATLVPDAMGSADATISIVRWDPGSRSMRWLLGFGSGEGEVDVTVQSVGVDGTAHGWVRGGFFGGSDENSAEAAGDTIAYTLATGLREPPKPQQNH